MVFKVFILLALVAVSLALPQYGRSRYEPVDPVGPAKYDFNWAVQDSLSGNNFGQNESRDGDSTRGSYYVLLPDGRTQKVTYYVNGDSGFVADVTYEGEARYPQPQPTYKYN